jgi:tetratricopeptide (TPR) repeat protein
MESHSTGSFKKKYVKLISWENFVKLFCGIAIILLLIIIVSKLINPTWLTEVKIEILLVALAVAMLIPYISSFEALGVKVTTKEKVKELSEWAKASPYYILGSEYEDEGDLIPAEEYYLKSLNECADFWPSLLGLGSIYHDRGDATHDPEEYSKAIKYYRQVLELNKDNIYAYNNLAAIYVNGPPLIKDLRKAIDSADKALENLPSLYDASYHKGVALNNQKAPESYREAFKTLQGIIDAGKLKDNVHLRDWIHWVMYELDIAKSNLGEAITKEDLEQMFDCAEKNSEDDILLDYLSRPDEQKRFKATDLPVIEQFLKEKSA